MEKYKQILEDYKEEEKKGVDRKQYTKKHNRPWCYKNWEFIKAKDELKWMDSVIDNIIRLFSSLIKRNGKTRNDR